jgi:polyphosphate kinase 2 (PPK2 family)
VEEQMDKLQFSQALAEIWKVIGECNKYIDLTQPWVLGKDPEKQGLLANVLLTLAECVRFVAVLIQPFMPSTPARIFAQLGVSDESLKSWESLKCFGMLPDGLRVSKGEALFPRIDAAKELQELDKLQARLKQLHNIIYRKKIPVILCYEGWDAAGKGGNIRRVARPLDPRGVDVIPIASPLPHELNRQYLWRFWTKLPRSGHFCIFDRTWYGRVMVERLEGFCSEDDWRRAYNEINEFERQLTDWGAVVLKFWIHIDQDTQLARFTDRQNTPEKQWKITEEDWRNREKWPLYEKAVDEMLEKTSTVNAPWHIIESNDKKYARIKTLKIIIKALEKACDEQIVRGLK